MRLTVAVAVLAGACQRDPAPPAPAPEPPAPEIIHAITPEPPGPPPPAQLQHVTLKAIGMNCPESCPISVRKALSSVPGIYEIGFDLDHEAVYVSYDAALGEPKEVTRPMLAAIRGVGFDPWLARTEWPADAQPLVHVVVR